MPQIRYITSQSQAGAPGVYIQELAPAQPIKGQRNRIASFIGQCCRGPVGIPVPIRGYGRFRDVFGDRDYNKRGGTIIGHVWKDLQAKQWGQIYVVRVAAAGAVAASFTANTLAAHAGTNVLQIDASSVGLWGNDVGFKVGNATNADANYFNLYIRLYGKVKVFENITIHGTDNNTNSVVGSDYATLIKLTKLAAGRPVNSTPSTDGADADGYVLLGQTVAGYVSVAGSDGAIANSDYTDAITLMNGFNGVNVCTVSGRSNTTIKTAIATAAGTAAQRVWYISPDDETVSVASAITERSNFSTQRMTYWYNHEYITDPITLEQILVEPKLLPMSIATQTDPDVHPGDFDNAVFSTGSRGVYASLSTDDRDDLDAGGVSFIWRDKDARGNDVTIPGNALTCDFSTNNRDLDGRFMKDVLLDAIGRRLQGDQFKGNTPDNRAERAADVAGFLTTLAKSNRYVLRDEQGNALFSYVNNESVNTQAEQADGDQHESLVCTLIPKNKRIFLGATIGVDAVVTEN
jgi:hypothetical protein